MTTEKVAIIIPALNEELALPPLLAEIPPDSIQEIFVVDNGSTDATARVATEAGATVVSELQRGYGRACLRGFQAAQAAGADILVFMDGDGSDDPADLARMLAPILERRADFVIGSRISKRAERGAILAQARFGNWLVSSMIRLFYGAHIHDIGSFRAIRSTSLEALDMQEMTYGWPVEMVVKAARADYRILEMPIHYRKRSHGQSKVAGTIAGSIKAAYYMLSTTLKYVGTKQSMHLSLVQEAQKTHA